MDVDHGLLDDVGSGALNDRVNGNSLGQIALPLVRQRGRIANAAHGAATIEDRADVAIAASLHQGLQQEGIDTRIALKVAVNEDRGVALVDSQALSQAERALSINHAKVYRLCAAPHLRRDLIERHSIDLAGDLRMDVPICGECLSQCGVARKVRQHAELDL